MKAKIESVVEITTTVMKEVDVSDFEQYVADNEFEINTVEDLRDVLWDYFYDMDYERTIPKKYVDLDPYVRDSDVLNLDEVEEHFKHLIVEKPEPTCCEQAPYAANFCPTCGKKLV